MTLVDAKRLAQIREKARLTALGRYHTENPGAVCADAADYAHDVPDLVETLQEMESERARADGCEDRERFLIAQLQSIEAERITPLVEQCERQKTQIAALRKENEQLTVERDNWQVEAQKWQDAADQWAADFEAAMEGR